jgi:hypothetical protein
MLTSVTDGGERRSVMKSDYLLVYANWGITKVQVRRTKEGRERAGSDGGDDGGNQISRVLSIHEH